MPDSHWPIKLLFVLVCCIPASHAFGQTEGPINTDRPDQTDAAYTLPQHYFQLETGVIYGKENDYYLLHNTLLRYGLLTNTEVRFGLDYGRQNGFTGILPVNFSVKQKIFESKSWLPTVAAIADVGLPFLSSSSFRPHKLPAGITMAFDHTLSDEFDLAYNAGAFMDGESDQVNWLATTNLGFSPSEKLSFFLEYFATFSSATRPEHNLDAGMLWLLQNNLQADLAVGTSIFRKASTHPFITVGISYRFDHRK